MNEFFVQFDKALHTLDNNTHSGKVGQVVKHTKPLLFDSTLDYSQTITPDQFTLLLMHLKIQIMSTFLILIL